MTSQIKNSFVGRTKKTFIFALGFVLCSATAFASSVNWIDWQTTTTGTVTVDGQVINVTLTADDVYGLSDGDYFYNNYESGYTTPGGTYGGLEPSDLIQVNQISSFTLTFDSPVEDLYMAMVSVGQPDVYFADGTLDHLLVEVTYSFEDVFSVETFGPNFWYMGGYSVNGTDLTGWEYNGILLFEGIFSSISFDVLTPEHWSGFNFAPISSPVPEPASMLLFGTGLIGLAGTLRRKKRSNVNNS